MKQVITSFTKYACIVACVLLAVACSSKSTTELEGLIGDNATAAVFVSQDAIAKSFDIKDGKLPEDITRGDLSVNDEHQIAQLLQLRGYDSKHLLILAYEKLSTMVVAGLITDEDALKESLTEAGFEQNANEYVNRDQGMTIFLRDGICWMVPSMHKAAEKVEVACNECSTNPAAAWKIEKLNDMSDADIYGIVNQQDNYFVFNAALNGPKLSGNMVMLDADGKAMIDTSTNTQTDLSAVSRYLDRQATIGLLFAGVKSMPELTSVAALYGYDELASLTTAQFAANLQIIDPTSTNESDFSNYAVQIALQAQPGKAEQLLECVNSLIESEIGVKSTGTATHRTFNVLFLKFTLDVEDDFVVARYGKNNIKQPIATGDNDGQFMHLFANVPSKLGLLNQPPFGLTLNIKADTDHMSFDAEFTDTKLGFLHCISLIPRYL
ncbi:MAG: hypothetical protein ACI4AM_08730 [Muribaculaceae bacterium]